jgi:hypothetical protein
VKATTDRLWDAVAEVAKLRHPSVAEILRRHAFEYEAGRMDKLIAAFDEMKESAEAPPPSK